MSISLDQITDGKTVTGETIAGGWNVGFVYDKTHAGTASDAIIRFNAFGGTPRAVRASTAVDGPDIQGQAWNADFSLKVPQMCPDGYAYGARRTPVAPQPVPLKDGDRVEVLRGPNKGKQGKVDESLIPVRLDNGVTTAFILESSLKKLA